MSETRDRQILLVANSHIDPVWLWDKYEGIDEVINTFRSACDRLDEYPDLCFSASSTLFYQWVERYAPEVFERIQAHVLAGRWEITGGWLVEVDCNLPGAASFHRSAEISRDYLSDRFGVTVEVAYSPDAFGHAATLPKILSNSGFRYYVFCRPSAQEKPDLPDDLFWWEYEGHRVLCYRLKYHYTQGNSVDFQRIDAALSDETLTRNGLACYFFGVGDHGGGPTRQEIDYLSAKIALSRSPQLRFSTCLDFFRCAEQLPGIPVYSGDLHYHAVGCYSVNRSLKHSNRSAERQLQFAERLTDGKDASTQARLKSLWGDVIFNQFHDILPGSCCPDAADAALDEMGRVRAECRDVIYEALKQKSRQVPVQCRQGEFRLYNSLDRAVTGPFEIESFMYYRSGAPFVDSEGKRPAIQKITPSVQLASRRWMFVDTIPARSMKAYAFESEATQDWVQDADDFFVTGDGVASETLELEAPGMILCRKTSKPLVRQPMRLGVIPDPSDTWSHGVQGYPKCQNWFEHTGSAISTGPVGSILMTRSRHDHSWAEIEYRLYKELPYVDLHIRVFWAEKQSILKLIVSLPDPVGECIVERPDGFVRTTASGAEQPLHGWLLTDGLGVLQDGAFAWDCEGGDLRITLVRSSLYGYDQVWKLDQQAPLRHTDLGEHDFRFRLFFNKGLTPRFMQDALEEYLEPFNVLREGI